MRPAPTAGRERRDDIVRGVGRCVSRVRLSSQATQNCTMPIRSLSNAHSKSVAKFANQDFKFEGGVRFFREIGSDGPFRAHQEQCNGIGEKCLSRRTQQRVIREDGHLTPSPWADRIYIQRFEVPVEMMPRQGGSDRGGHDRSSSSVEIDASIRSRESVRALDRPAVRAVSILGRHPLHRCSRHLRGNKEG